MGVPNSDWPPGLSRRDCSHGTVHYRKRARQWSHRGAFRRGQNLVLGGLPQTNEKIMMKRWGYWIATQSLQFVAILLCVIAFVPILYPVVLIAGSLIAILCLALIITFPYISLQPDRPSPSAHPRRAAGKAALRLRRIREFEATRRVFRSLLITLFAMIFSFGYMGVVKLYSWIFYIKPMSRELEPYRKLYREGQSEFRPIDPGLDKLPR